MSQEPQKTYEILIPIYPGVNTLDVNGPLDVLCNFALRSEEPKYAPFNVTITALEKEVKAYEFITLKADIQFDEAIKNIENGDYDILLVPGATSTAIDNIIKKDVRELPDKTETFDLVKDAPILKVIQAFVKNDTKKGLQDQKWLFSVCTGALLVGAAGGFADIDVTTHWGAIKALPVICEKAGAPAKSVERKRWVDGGKLKAESGKKIDTRVLSSGGISCGLDASLWLVKELLGTGSAFDVAAMMDYNWNVQYTTQSQLW